MSREGRLYYQYLEFITWEELPLPSPARSALMSIPGTLEASWEDSKSGNETMT